MFTVLSRVMKVGVSTVISHLKEIIFHMNYFLGSALYHKINLYAPDPRGPSTLITNWFGREWLLCKRETGKNAVTREIRLQICIKIRGLGCVTRTLTRVILATWPTYFLAFL